MPIYEFRCKKCGNQIEVIQKISDKPPARCKKCGGRLEKMISQTAFQLKGEGWYVTEYGRKNSVSEKKADGRPTQGVRCLEKPVLGVIDRRTSR